MDKYQAHPRLRDGLVSVPEQISCVELKPVIGFLLRRKTKVFYLIRGIIV